MEATEEIGLFVAWWLAVLAGAVDACGYSALNHLYVSFMSGNTTSFGIAMAHLNWSRAETIATIVAAFVAGAAAGSVIVVLARRRHLTVVIGVVAALLAVPPLVPAAAIPAMTFAMGLLNSAMHRAGPVQVSITYATGALVKLGQGFGFLLTGRTGDWRWLIQAVPWTGLLAGAIAATLSLSWYGGKSFIYLPILAAAIGLLAWPAQSRLAAPQDGQKADPT